MTGARRRKALTIFDVVPLPPLTVVTELTLPATYGPVGAIDRRGGTRIRPGAAVDAEPLVEVAPVQADLVPALEPEPEPEPALEPVLEPVVAPVVAQTGWSPVLEADDRQQEPGTVATRVRGIPVEVLPEEPVEQATSRRERRRRAKQAAESEPGPATDVAPAPVDVAPVPAPPITKRAYAGTVVAGLCMLCAVILAVSALLLYAQANEANALVRWVNDAATHLDLGVFDVSNGVMKFNGERADLKNALFNRGLAALVWVVFGTVAQRIIAGRG